MSKDPSFFLFNLLFFLFNPAMQRLIEGVHKFRNEEFGNYRKLFRRLSQVGQNPHTLFITCSDSRVLAELITQSKPGDLFVVKNIGNIVPPASAVGDTNSTAAAIEFAVEMVRVDDIVVCGHSQCGAIEALLGRTVVRDSTPHLRDWLKLAAPVLETLKAEYQHLHDDNARSTAAAEENVLYSLDNLHSYPCVQERLADGSLRLHGWFFKIATAELFAYDPETRQFTPLVDESLKR
ncbi:MAG TPA: carbonic anhydrase [Verrucomicrobiae bacterium]|nr:carbonic anhydrase [Verrucomicrobiae bacterium]